MGRKRRSNRFDWEAIEVFAAVGALMLALVWIKGSVGDRFEEKMLIGQVLSANLMHGEGVKVLLYPHSGIVVDFVDKPLGLCGTDEERVSACKEKYGYPYLLEMDGTGMVAITQNPAVPQSIFTRYARLMDYEAFWISYNGGKPYDSYLSSARAKDSIAIHADGTYEIQIGKKDGLILSDRLVIEVENDCIVNVNGEATAIKVFDPVRPAASDEEYSREISQFISDAEGLGYQVDLEMYHYIYERDGIYFKYKYVKAFSGNLQSSIQVYECETEDDAILTFESWIDTYGTMPTEITEQNVYALRGNSSEADNGVLLRKGKIVYIFWDENLDEAKEMAEWFAGTRNESEKMFEEAGK